MSLVVAIKDKDRIVLGSDKQGTLGNVADHTCTKIWNVPEFEGAIMGGVGSARASQIIQYTPIIDKNVVPEDITIDYIICNVAPTLLATLEANGIKCDGDDIGMKALPNCFLFAYKDKAWIIYQDLSVAEITDYLAIGSGSEVARGALYATAGKNVFDRIVTSIYAAADMTLYVDDDLDILCTKTLKSDAKNLSNALGFNYSELVDEIKPKQEDSTQEEKTEFKPVEKEVEKPVVSSKTKKIKNIK